MNLHEQIEGMGGAFTMALIAFTVVFLVLGGLSGIIYGIKYLAAGAGKKKDPLSGGGNAAAPASAERFVASGGETADGNKLLAVLTAAVAATEGRGSRITVVRPLSSAAPRGGLEWKRVGIMETLSGTVRGWK